MSGTTSLGLWLESVAELSPPVAVLAKVTILLGIAWLVHSLLRRANPRWRVLLWRAAAVGMLLIPLCHLVTPPMEFRVSTASIVAAHDGAMAIDGLPTDGAPADQKSTRRAGHPVGEDSLASDPVAPFIDTNENQSSLWVWLAVWSGGSLLCLFRVAAGMIRIRSLVTESETAPAEVEAKLARVARELSVTSKADVRVSTRISAPILCGFFRSTLLIPTRMTEPSRADRLPGVFAHELAHVQSRDLVWNLLLHVVSIAFWFHPLAWFARAVHAAACEAVSDAVAADYLGDVQAYGRTLAQVALDAASAPTLSLAMARTSDVHRRVQTLERRLFSDGLHRQLAGLVVVGGLMITSALGGFKAVRAEVAVQPPQAGDDQKTEADVGQSPGESNDAAAKSGGDVDQPAMMTAETVAAVNKGLAFLVARQRDDGSFGGKEVGDHDPAVTALCGIALLAAGSKPGEGPYGAELQKALDYLLNQVQDDGFIGIRPSAGSMYVHAYALRFLAEAQLAHETPQTEKAIAKAVDLIVKSQNNRDGWRYRPNSQDADSSVTSCLVIALQAARRAGAQVPKETLDRAVNYLKRCQTPDGGYSYVMASTGSALPRSAAAMAALYLSDVRGEEVEKGLAYLNANATSTGRGSPHYFYGQFHLSTALRFAGEEHFRRWYGPSRDELLASQADNGSWPLQYYQPEYPTASACIVLLSPRKPISNASRPDQ